MAFLATPVYLEWQLKYFTNGKLALELPQGFEHGNPWIQGRNAELILHEVLAHLQFWAIGKLLAIEMWTHKEKVCEGNRVKEAVRQRSRVLDYFWLLGSNLSPDHLGVRRYGNSQQPFHISGYICIAKGKNQLF